MNIKPDISKNLLDNSSPLKPSINRNASLESQGGLSRATSQDSTKKTSCKRKQDTNLESSTANRRSKKIRTNAKSPEIASKPTRLHLLKDDDLALKRARQDIKAISERESIFGALFFELRTVLKILQELNPLARRHSAPDKINNLKAMMSRDLFNPSSKKILLRVLTKQQIHNLRKTGV